MKDKCVNGHELTNETRTRRFVNGSWKYHGCKVCAIARSKKWHRDNKERASLGGKRRYLLNRVARLKKMKERQCLVKHGITLQQRDNILKQQGHRCANSGCRRKLPPRGGHLDHDHKTGKHRGILCSQCNMVLGLVQDTCVRLLGLVNYLQGDYGENSTATHKIDIQTS